MQSLEMCRKQVFRLMHSKNAHLNDFTSWCKISFVACHWSFFLVIKKKRLGFFEICYQPGGLTLLTIKNLRITSHPPALRHVWNYFEIIKLNFLYLMNDAPAASINTEVLWMRNWSDERKTGLMQPSTRHCVIPWAPEAIRHWNRSLLWW